MASTRMWYYPNLGTLSIFATALRGGESGKTMNAIEVLIEIPEFKQQDYYGVAVAFRRRGFHFVQAYEMIFGRAPRASHLSDEDRDHLTLPA